MMIAFLLLAIASGEGRPCEEILAGGDRVVSRFFPVPPSRAREATSDAMQGAGALIFKDFDRTIEGERAVERIAALGLPPGDEAVFARIEPSSQGGVAGSWVEVETRRRGGKKGNPKRCWSSAVLQTAACLLDLLNIEDPARRTRDAVSTGKPVLPALGTSLDVRLRRFLYSASMRPGQKVTFETASDLVVDGVVVAPRGSLVVARYTQKRDIGEFGRKAEGGLVFESATLRDGTRIPLRGAVELQGKSGGSTAGLAVAAVALSPVLAGVTGTGFCIPAGTLFRAEIAGPPAAPGP